MTPNPANNEDHSSEHDLKNSEQRMGGFDPERLGILVVDDEPAIGQTMQKMLNRKKFLNVAVARNGSDALQQIKQTEFAIIFLDLGLPNVSGLDVLRFLKNDPKSRCKQAEVIIVTGLPTLESAVDCMKEGAFHYLIKPVEMNRIYEVFYHALKKYQIDQAPKGNHDEAAEKDKQISQLKQSLEEKNAQIEQLQAKLKKNA